MPLRTQNRKHFIKTLGIAGMAIFLQKAEAYGKKMPFALLHESNENVLYYSKFNKEYDVLRKGFNKRINNYPNVIAVCKNTAGVADAIAYARENNLKVTVKSGGHCMEGLSCLQGGLVINLSLLNSVEFIDGNSIKVGPACTLKKIYETLIPRGKYLPGGSCQSVAIGGLSLGGGYGLLSRQYGLTCDSLQEVTMVTGNGNIVNTKNNSELLWACKGGGNGNFGAVTEMIFKVQKAPAVMQSIKFRHQQVSTEKAIEICRTWFTLSKTLPASCFSAFIFNGHTTYILLTNTQKNNEAANHFTDTFKALSTKVSTGRALPLGQALKNYYAEANPITFKNASAGLYRDFSQIENVLPEVFALVKKTPGIIYQVNTLGGNIQNAALEQASSFAHRDCFYFSELQAYWESPAAGDKFLKNFEAIQQLFAKAGIAAQYRNYPDINFKNTNQLYYSKNIARLQAVKNLYDADDIFAAPQSLRKEILFPPY